MDFGNKRHVTSDDDLTILHCYACGWFSEELTLAQMHDRGLPWYCDHCGRQNLRFVHFHPSERSQARYEIGIIDAP